MNTISENLKPDHKTLKALNNYYEKEIYNIQSALLIAYKTHDKYPDSTLTLGEQIEELSKISDIPWLEAWLLIFISFGLGIILGWGFLVR